MSAAKHTPGPWEACGFDVRSPLVDGGFLVATVGESPLGAECAANASLIAAAPELLAVAREYVEAFELWYITNTHGARDFDFTGRIAALARAAIAKAEGSAP